MRCDSCQRKSEVQHECAAHDRTARDGERSNWCRRCCAQHIIHCNDCAAEFDLDFCWCCGRTREELWADPHSVFCNTHQHYICHECSELEHHACVKDLTRCQCCGAEVAGEELELHEGTARYLCIDCWCETDDFQKCVEADAP